MLEHASWVLARVEFLGEMSNVLHSRAPLPLIPPTPFSHKGRRGILGILKHKTREGTQGFLKNLTPVRVVEGDGSVMPALL